MFGLRNLLNKTQTLTLCAPLNGRLIENSKLPDPTFANSILGSTAAFEPSEGQIYAPCDGQITQLFRTSHALTITSESGIEILIHIGINTVDLKGRGFKSQVEQNQQVKQGDPLISFELETIKEAGLSILTPMVICNSDDFKDIKFIAPCEVNTQTVIGTLVK